MAMEIEIGTGTGWLRDRVAPWDDLWRRSNVTLPTARAESLACYADRFATSPFRAVVIRDGGTWIAAIPLVERLRGGWLRSLSLPHNEWFTGGTALIDRQVAADDGEVAELAGALIAAMEHLDWRALLWDDLAHDGVLWESMSRAMTQRGWYAAWEDRARIAWLPVERFEQTLSHLSKGTRKKLRRAERQWRAEGAASLRVLTPIDGRSIAPWVQQAIEIEDHKSLRGDRTSIRSAGLADFFHRQASLVAAHGEFVLAQLEAAGEPVAFEYGWLAKGTYHALKVGYLPCAARYLPGHLLMWKLGEHLFRRGDVQRIDCLCNADSPLARTWRTEAYATHRLWACRPAWLGHTLAWGLKQRRLLARVTPPGPSRDADTPTSAPSATAPTGDLSAGAVLATER